ncbi:hypothetical protein GOARA_076_00480 [Gordonia araii NBRC 100433]|uniref:DUF2550 domain-containing protein n=2 Tax=Gordonia araii TaxID=263909 RepID=G7H6R3_9ACTN|nr:DUF2550 domain-containing protein [Gordonia araii]NNG98626.1 DUF2550 family protein [Gordonia araii NBRC 100433]GAB11538.1 hypothetical protein GOARA_076_00480 [Gordonia araii NBRC 100433]
MIIGVIVLAIALVVATVVAAAAVYRLSEMRRTGTPILLRPIPAAEDQGWRHGSAHYGDNTLVYYRLVTFWRGPTVTLIRSAMTVVAKREPRGTEREILDGMVIIELAPGADGDGGAYELGMPPEALTALQAWLESSPPRRAHRRSA